MGSDHLDRFFDPRFDPRSVAVVGASDRKDSVGRTLMRNLTSGDLSGKVFPVNPRRREVLGITCVGSISDLEEDIDLAVVATPIATTPQIIRECADSGIEAAIIVSAGGGEAGDEGRKIEEKIREKAVNGPIRVLGSNCLGFIRPAKNINTSFAKQMPPAGDLAFISQSGAIGTAIQDYATRERIRFSHLR